MELLLKRNEKPGALGTRYDLFAKLELKPEELASIRKAKPDKTIIVEDEFGRNNFKWRLMWSWPHDSGHMWEALSPHPSYSF